MESKSQISCNINDQKSWSHYEFKISIPQTMTDSFFDFALESQQHSTQTIGFKKGTIPVTYLQKHFKTPIINHLKEIALKFFGLSSLLKHIKEKKVILVGFPKLTDIEFDQNNGSTTYHFKAYKPTELYMQSWKYLPFKPIVRKKYRDIDRQVKAFLEEEDKLFHLYKPQNGIQIGDWVNFNAWLISSKNERIFQGEHTNLWLKIGDEEPDFIVQKQFIGKQIGDSFISDIAPLQNYFCESSDNNYLYEINIKDIVPHAYFSLPLFKNYFKIKTQKDLQNKLTEVFSFHHDMSQRRLMTIEALDLITKKNQIILPDSAINIQKKELLTAMQSRSDFMVYKMNQNFDQQITNLAKKQLSDAVIADCIAYQDNLSVSDLDAKGFLHLTQRPRIKEFIYFPFIKSQTNGQEVPIEQETVHHICLKEKAVNHIIHHLTKE
ncbi:hypothetical protein HYV11_02265 [Candidatus Dependentiae bacterium]|nr:hypothetical protein [Candidatus Dependentiae bacterium]